MPPVEYRALVIHPSDEVFGQIRDATQHLSSFQVFPCSRCEDAEQQLLDCHANVLFTCLNTDVLELLTRLPALNGRSLPLVIGLGKAREDACTALDYGAQDFLLEPVDPQRLRQSLLRLPGPPVPPGERPFGEAIFIRFQSKYIRLPLTSIDWIEAIGDYVNIFTGKRRYTVHMTMKVLQARLPPEQFIRVHRSYIVRLACIQELEDNTICVNNETFIPLGKSYRQQLFTALNVI